MRAYKIIIALTTILFSTLALLAHAQYNQQGVGTIIGSWITTDDDFATFDANQGFGGYHQVQTIDDMLNITYQRQATGMVTFVIDEDKTYRLIQRGQAPGPYSGAIGKPVQYETAIGTNRVEINFGGSGGGYWTQSGNNIYNQSLTGNVGINTSNPQKALDVSGNVIIGGSGNRLYLYTNALYNSLLPGLTTFNGNLVLQSQTSKNVYINRYVDGNTYIQSNGNTIASFLSGGYVGINRTTPTDNLSIVGNAGIYATPGNYSFVATYSGHSSSTGDVCPNSTDSGTRDCYPSLAVSGGSSYYYDRWQTTGMVSQSRQAIYQTCYYTGAANPIINDASLEYTTSGSYTYYTLINTGSAGDFDVTHCIGQETIDNNTPTPENSMGHEYNQNGFYFALVFTATDTSANSQLGLGQPCNIFNSHIIDGSFDAFEDGLSTPPTQDGTGSPSLVTTYGSRTGEAPGCYAPYSEPITVMYNKTDIFAQIVGDYPTLYTTGSIIGIGTTGPTETVDINGTLRIRSLPNDTTDATTYVLATNNNGVVYELENTFAQSGDVTNIENTVNNLQNALLWTAATDTGSNIYNVNTGNVGIGTNTPDDLLDVRGKSIFGQNTTRFYLYQTNSFNSDYAGIKFYQNNPTVNAKSGGTVYINQDVVADTHIQSDNTSIAFFDANGNIGLNQTGPTARLHMTDGALLAEGSQGDTPTSGGGTRLMWIPSLSAFRAGYVFSNGRDESNVGAYSNALGYDSIAIGDKSFAAGTRARAAHDGAYVRSDDQPAVWTSVIQPAGISSGVSYSESIAKDILGNIYVTYSDALNTNVVAKKRNGSDRTTIGGTGLHGHIGLEVRMGIDSNDNIYVAYQDNDATSVVGGIDYLSVKRWNGASRAYIGGTHITDHKVNDIDLTVDSSDNVYVAYNSGYGGSSNNRVRVQKWNGSSRSFLDFGLGGIEYMDTGYRPSIITDSNDEVYIAYMSLSQGKMLFKQRNGSSRTNIPITVSVGSTVYDNIDMAIDDNDNIYIVFHRYIDSSRKTSVIKYDGSSRSELGSQVVNGKGSNLAIAIDPIDNSPTVSYNSNVIKKWNGSTWVTQDGTDDITITARNLLFTDNGKPYGAGTYSTKTALYEGPFPYFASTAANQYLIRAERGVGINTNEPVTALDVDGLIRTRPRASATCDTDTEGAIFYDSDDSHFYGCNGTGRVQLDN